MAEIHRAREIIYKETRGMNAKEKSEWIHKEAEKVKKDYQLRLSKAER